MIEVVNLRVRRGGRPVLDRVNLRVPAGEALALVGPNGAGKTLLLRTMATLQAPDSGDVLIAGRSVVDEPAAARALLGWVPDVTGILPGTMVVDDIGYHAGLLGVVRTRRREAADRVVSLLGLDSVAMDPVESLSQGQRKRLGLARALVHEPQVLLIDGLAGLDRQARDDLGPLVADLRDQRCSLVIAGHDPDAMARIYSLTGILAEGSVTVEPVTVEPVTGPAGSSPEPTGGDRGIREQDPG